MQKLLELYFSFLLNLVFGVCRLLYRLEVEGLPHVPPQGPVISVGNHASLLDSFLLIHLIRKVRSDVYIYGGGGPLWSPRSLRAMRGIPSPRGVGRAGSLLWSALRELQSGCPIAIAAEGAIRWDGRRQPFQPGAAWLALRSGAPIVVCVLRGGYCIWPRWQTFPRLTGRLKVRIGKPFTLSAPQNQHISPEMIRDAGKVIAEEMARLEAWDLRRSDQVNASTSQAWWTNRLLRRVSALLVRLTLRLFGLVYHLNVSGAENLPTLGPCIVVDRHVCRLDGIITAFLFHLRPDLYIHRPVGDRRPRVLPGREAPAAGPASVGPGLTLWTPLKMLQARCPVLIFPEGMISWDGRLQPFRPGAAWLALRSQAPLVVCVLRGGYSIWPRWATFPKLTGRLQLRIGKPFIIPQAGSGRVTREAIEAVNQKIVEEMQRLEAEP